MEIKIEIDDVRIFASAAYILDQEDILNKIHEIRLYWKIPQDFISYEYFDNWYSNHSDDLILTPDVKNYWGELDDFSFTQTAQVASPEKTKEIIYSNPIDLELEHLQRKKGIPPQLKKFMLKAIVCNEVRLFDWENINNNEKFIHDNGFFNMPLYEKLYHGDTKQEIKTHRIWYWESERGKKPLQIAKEIASTKKWIDVGNYRKTIDNAISRYKEFLVRQGTIKMDYNVISRTS